jgi:hypothetical protein
MVINPGKDGVIHGTFIARGEGSTIDVKTTGTLDLYGSLIAQDGISISAGSKVIKDSVSIQTHASGIIKTLSDDSMISIKGVNDVNIDTTVGQDGADLEYIEIISTDGTLSIGKDSGKVITTGKTLLSANDLVLAGVVKSDYYTESSYDNEFEIKTKGNIEISGEIDTKGSMLISGSGNVDIYNTKLIADTAGDKIEISAGKNLNLGTKKLVEGSDDSFAVEIQANKYLSLSADEILNIGYDVVLLSNADDSSIEVNAGTLNHAGALQAGATIVDNSIVASGKDAELKVSVDESFIIGAQGLNSDKKIVDVGAVIKSSGDMDISSGANESSVGLVLSKLSSIVSTGDATISTDGSAQLDGVLKTDGEKANLSISSAGLMYIDTLIYATGDLSVIGGTSENDTGLYLKEFTLDADGNRLTGGTLDTKAGSSITLGATDNVFINGVVGQLDENGKSKIDTINLVSDSGTINVLQSIDAINKVTVKTKELNLVQSTAITTSSDSGVVSIDASAEVYIQKATQSDKFDAQIKTATLEINSGSLVLEGILTATNESANNKLISTGDTKIIGSVTTSGNLQMGAKDLNVSTQGKLDIEGDLVINSTGKFNLNADTSIGGTKTILIPKFVTVEKTVKRAGGTTQVEAGTYTVKVSSGMTKTISTELVAYEEIDIGDKYYTFDIKLVQDGYYSSSKGFREAFIEGVDYNNSNNALQGQTTDYKDLGNYNGWSGLSDDEKTAIIEQLGYKRAYQTVITNVVEHVTRDGVVTQNNISSSQLPWASETQDWQKVDADGFRDIYVNIAEGFKDYILNAVFENSEAAAQELVGQYYDEADVEYKQVSSSFTTGDNGAAKLIEPEHKPVSITIKNDDGSTTTASSFSDKQDFDNAGASWDVTYTGGSGKRYFIMTDEVTADKLRDPNWDFESSAKISGVDESGYKSYANDRFTTVVNAKQLYLNTLKNNTDSINQTANDSAGLQNVGSVKYQYESSKAVQGEITLYEHPLKDEAKSAKQVLKSNADGTEVIYILKNKSQVPVFKEADGSEHTWNNEISAIKMKEGTTYWFSVDKETDFKWKIVENMPSWDLHTTQYAPTKAKYPDKIDFIKVAGKEASFGIDTAYYSEEFKDFKYHWKSNMVDIYDSRMNYSYNITTKPEDIFDKKAIYATVEKQTESFVTEEKTIWKTTQAPDIEERVLFTELKEVEGQGRSVAKFGTKSITANNITINTVSDVNIKGAIEAAGDFTLASSDGKFSIDGVVANHNGADIDVLSLIEAKDSMSISADKGVNIAEKSLLELSNQDGDMDITSGKSMVIDGELVAGATLDAKAGADVELKSKIIADTSVSVVISEGSQNGNLITNEEFVTDTVSLTLGAGDNGGDLIITNSILKASDSITLSAKSGEVKTPTSIQTISDTDVKASALVTTNALSIEGGNDVDIKAYADSVDVKINNSGDLTLLNYNSLAINSIEVDDGAINIEALGDISIGSIKSLSGSNRADISIKANKTDSQVGKISVDTIDAAGYSDILLTANQIIHEDTGVIRANVLELDVPSTINLKTDVDTMRFKTKGTADVTINQTGDKTVTFEDIVIADGILDVTSVGSVVLDSINMLTSAKDITVSSQGSIGVNSIKAINATVTLDAGANIYESKKDIEKDIETKILNLSAKDNISSMDILVSNLNKAKSTDGSVELNSIGNMSLELGDIKASDSIDIVAKQSIITNTSSSLVADTIKLKSLEKNISVVSGSTFTQSKGVALVANNGIFDIFKFASGSELTQYETSGDFQFGSSSKLGAISSDKVILKTSGNIVVDGEIKATSLVDLEAGENVTAWGISGKSGSVGSVNIIAKGESPIQKNGATIDGGNIIISKGNSGIGTAFLANKFDLRAKSDIRVYVDSNVSVSGFIGGLEGLESAKNIKIKTADNNLYVNGAIISASDMINLENGEIHSDSSSVFIAKDLNVKALGNITLNTKVDTIELDSKEKGNVSIVEADDIHITRADVRDGSFDILSGEDITLEAVRTHVGNSANSITIKALGDVYGLDDGQRVNLNSSSNTGKSTDDVTVFASTLNVGEADVSINRNSSSSSSNIYMTSTAITGTKTISGGGDYTIVKMPINSGAFSADEVLSLSAGSDLAVVVPIDVGAGSVVLNSGGGIGLGGAITANKLTVNLRDDIAIESNVNSMDISVSGSGDVKIDQSGDLSIERLATNGGDVYIYVDGNVDIQNLSGRAKSFTVEVSDGHTITIDGTTYQSGTTTLIAKSGDVSANMDMDSLELESSGTIELTDKDSFVLNRYATTDRTKDFSLKSDSGVFVINSDISRVGSGNLVLDVGGIKLSESLSSENSIAITSASTISMDSGVVIDAGSADISLVAQDDIKLGQLKTTSVNDLVVTSVSGAIIDINDNSLNIDSKSAKLVISAKNGIGSVDALETDISSIQISNSTSGDVNIYEIDNLDIIAYSNSGAAGSIVTESGDIIASSMSAGSMGTLKLDTNNITLNGDIITTGASVDIIANKGNLSLVHTIVAGANGSISLEAIEGIISTDINDNGSLVLGEDILLDAKNGGVTLKADGTIDALIDSKELFISSASKADINIKALQDLKISNKSVSVVNIDTPSGKQAFLTEFDTGDKDIDFTATDLDIQDSIKTTGNIEVKTKSPNMTLRFGGTKADKSEEYTLNLEESKKLSDVIEKVKIGSKDTVGDIVFGDDTSNKSDESKIDINSDLEIETSGKTFLNSNLDAESILLYGPHFTLELNANMSADNQIEVHDSIKVGGENSVVAGTYMTLTSNAIEYIQGDSRAGDDKLVLNANNGDINISGNIGATAGTQFDGANVDNLEGFSIIDSSDNSAGAIDVNIAQDMYIEGDVTIYATGDIKFGGVVNVTGNLNIIGAKSITFASTVTVGSDMSLEANEIDFNDVVDSVDVKGDITLKATDNSRAVLVAQDTINSSALNIDKDDLASIKDGFSGLSFGKESGGDVKLSTAREYSSNLGVYGANITIQDNDTNSEFELGGNLDISATKNITLSNTIVTNNDISLKTTGGKAKLASDERLTANNLVIEANSGIKFDNLILKTTLSAKNSGSGSIDLNILDTSSSTINVLALDQLDATNSADISLTHQKGSLVVSGANVAGSGDVNIVAQSGSITMNDTSTTGSGDILLNATNNINIETGSNMSSTNYSKITLLASTGSINQKSNVTTEGGLITYNSADDIVMSSSAITSTIDATNNDGKIIFNAVNDLALGSVGADGVIEITVGGAVTDSDSSDDTVLNLFGDTTTVKIEANNGVGASTNGDIDTKIASISVLNKRTNGIYIEDKDDLVVNSNNIISKSEIGNIELTSNGGDITIANTISNNATNGSVKIKAQNIIDSTMNDDIEEVSAQNISLIATVGSISSMNVDTFSIVYEAQSGDTTIVNPNVLEINSIKGGSDTFTLTTKKIFANSSSTVDGNIISLNLDGDDLSFGTTENKISTSVNRLNLNYTAKDINIDESDDIIINTVDASKAEIKADNLTMTLSGTNSALGTSSKAARLELDTINLTIGDGVINIDEKDNIAVTITQSQSDTEYLSLKSREAGDITIHSNVITDSRIDYDADELIFTTDAKDMLGVESRRLESTFNKITGVNLSDMYINHKTDITLNITSANDVDIDTDEKLIVEKNMTLNSLKLDQEKIINNIITDKITTTDMNLISSAGIDIDLSADIRLTLDSSGGIIDVTNTENTTLGGHENKHSISVGSDNNINISSKSITFGTNSGYKDIVSSGSGDINLTSTSGDIATSKAISATTGDITLVSSNDMSIDGNISTGGNILLRGKNASVDFGSDNKTFGTASKSISTDLDSLTIKHTVDDMNIVESDNITINAIDTSKVVLKANDVTLNLSATDSSLGTALDAAKLEVDALNLTIGSGLINIDEKDNIALTITQSQNSTSSMKLVSKEGDITINSNIKVDSDISYNADELIFTTDAKDMLGKANNRASTNLNKLTGDNLKDIYIDEIDSLVLNIKSADSVDIKATSISSEQNTNIKSLKLEQQSSINNTTIDKITTSNMNLISNSDIDIDLSADTTLTLESKSGNITLTNTENTTLGKDANKDSITVSNHKIDISSKSITFNTNSGYKDIASSGNADIKLTSTSGDISLSRDIDADASNITLVSNNSIAINQNIETVGTININSNEDINMHEDAIIKSDENIDIKAKNINVGKINSKKTITMTANEIQQSGLANTKSKLVSDTLSIKSLDSTAEENYKNNPTEENKAKMVKVGKSDNPFEIKANNITKSTAEPFWYYGVIKRPTLEIISDVEGTISKDIELKFSFSDTVSGFDVDDIVIENGEVSSDIITSDNIDFIVSIKPKTNFAGELKVSIAEDSAFDSDDVGNSIAEPFIIDINTLIEASAIYDTYGKLVLVDSDILDIPEPIDELGIELNKEYKEAQSITYNEEYNEDNHIDIKQEEPKETIYMKIDREFNVDNSIMPLFDVLSLKPANLVDFNEEEFSYEYWINSFII